MIASKTWHCSCCGETINPGDTFTINQGDFLKEGHSMNTAAIIQPVAGSVVLSCYSCADYEPGKPCEFMSLMLNGNCHSYRDKERSKKKIKTEQLELVPVTHDYTKHKRELPEQQDIQDLPLFNEEYQKTEQLNLFA
jgi:hypothetical protein